MTTANTPQHNGIVERLNRTLLDKTRAMLSDANLPKSYWLEALNYAVHLHNISPSNALTTMPTEAYSGTKPDVSQLRVFGCTAHIHVSEHSQDKLAAHSLPCTFLGFANNRSAFHLIHRLTKKFIESRDVVFNEGGPTPRHERIIPNPMPLPPLSLLTQLQQPLPHALSAPLTPLS
jgi:hypothetical protein